MVMKIATTCLQWSSQPTLPHSPSSSQTLASAISSPSSKRQHNGRVSGSLLCRFVSTPLHRARSFDHHPLSNGRTIRRTCSASLQFFSSFDDEEFDKKIQDLALRFQLSDDNNNNNAVDSDSEAQSSSNVNFEPPWSTGEELIPANILRKANSVELPFSLRIIKKKLQWKEDFREAGELAYCSVKKAFSSMVFIIRELQSFTLQMREILYYEDLQGILARVQREMHASFVWLFQQVFSHTPTLMVYVMILLANFTVYSMGHNAAIAATAMPPPPRTTTEVASASTTNFHGHKNNKIDSSSIKTFSFSTNGNNTASIGGGNGDGGKHRPAVNGNDGGDGRFDRSDRHQGTVVPTGGGSQSQAYKTGETQAVSGKEEEEEEAKLWDSIVEEVSTMEVGLDREAMKRFVSPVMARIESDEEYAEYLRTELVYQTGLSQEPNNALLLANYAQFLYLVAHEYDRAEEYFKRAIEVDAPDAEAYNKYATFLWKVKNDLWAAEETYLEAISAEPTNSYYAANYAHFLWNTGGEDTCFPLSSPDTSQEV
ncbi:hypothetical protein Lal_00017016 [Lupinus albus]|uniref:Putative tetratricopeptide-like helical domain-containing protein n=1 Tax=Lupinus albus TaxID=3870 RepID=A0A6A4NYF4_LUPAL|nr:putative tetratricopeptide-like helical domain-containing protein [Lupinus albus]KAF1891384.1 hypothetical protein Lal_00017016 [Lupinus albus]